MNAADVVTALAALAQSHRLAAFRRLVQAGPAGLTVGALREALDVPAATLSAHLNTLRRAGLVADTREGRAIRVRADFTRMALLLAYLTENCCGGEPCAPADRAAPCR
ncbi:metalloregulator ArsR/SmtB family transcription factor [Silanimonas sp.]|uniref:ArsR/SmtB family transcription factor n=1 Tax=Silanimonas sp. TaxID=1929290 RepID=UPI001BC645E9|nr:metalloregulator ArsR/SmtB family transcription factor [Silanimonas sp.]MBS3897108.1 helix-turn-helix transcriptional regulator [Silanimonas sp.]MBS3923942.1 helix-turn-helix transcriptional regulator [Xanthomonadaceae bacterium]